MYDPYWQILVYVIVDQVKFILLSQVLFGQFTLNLLEDIEMSFESYFFDRLTFYLVEVLPEIITLLLPLVKSCRECLLGHLKVVLSGAHAINDVLRRFYYFFELVEVYRNLLLKFDYFRSDSFEIWLNEGLDPCEAFINLDLLLLNGVYFHIGCFDLKVNIIDILLKFFVSVVLCLDMFIQCALQHVKSHL